MDNKKIISKEPQSPTIVELSNVELQAVTGGHATRRQSRRPRRGSGWGGSAN